MRLRAPCKTGGTAGMLHGTVFGSTLLRSWVAQCTRLFTAGRAIGRSWEHLGELCGAHDVLVLERVQLVTRDGVPHARAEVCGAGDGVRGGNVQRSGPDRALVAFEGPDPVAALTVANHRLAICGCGTEESVRPADGSSRVWTVRSVRRGSRTLGCAHEKVPVFGDAAVRDLDDWPVVATCTASSVSSSAGEALRAWLRRGANLLWP